VITRKAIELRNRFEQQCDHLQVDLLSPPPPKTTILLWQRHRQYGFEICPEELDQSVHVDHWRQREVSAKGKVPAWCLASAKWT
jgi:hypothetical protein